MAVQDYIGAYLEAKEELANRVTDADALLSTGAPPQLVYDDQGPVTCVVDYVRDLWGRIYAVNDFLMIVSICKCN